MEGAALGTAADGIDADDDDEADEVALERDAERPEPEEDGLADNEIALATGIGGAEPEDDGAEDDTEDLEEGGAEAGLEGSEEDGAEEGAEEELEVLEIIGVDALFFCAFLSFLFRLMSFR